MVRLTTLLTSLASLHLALSSSVVDLLPKTFDSVVLNGKPSLVEFFAPWCGHCKNLAPVYEELATSYAHAGDKVVIAKVDADAHKDLGKRFGITGFPTIKWFDGKSDSPEDYKGGRDLESFQKFINEKTGAKSKGKVAVPSEVVMLTDESFKKTIGSDKNVLVAFTAPWCGHCKTLAPIWEKVATDFSSEDNVMVAKVDAEAPNSKQTASDNGVSSYPTIKFFPAGSSVAEDYSGGRSEDAFVTFLNEKAGSHRLVGGGLDTSAGTIDILDTIVAKMTDGNVAYISEEISKAAASLKDKYAEYYVKVMGKSSSDKGYLAKELARLEGILAKKGLAPAKTDDLVSRSNILRRFVDAAKEKIEDVKVKVEEIKEEL